MMRFVFVRHGHYDKTRDRSSRDRASLTEQGRTAARVVGEFLREHGVSPDLVCTTMAERTQETARIALAELGQATPLHPQDGGFGQGAGSAEIEERVATWARAAGVSPTTVLFVGHHVQQNACLRSLGRVAIPKDNKACALIYEKGVAGWRLVAHWVGL